MSQAREVFYPSEDDIILFLTQCTSISYKEAATHLVPFFSKLERPLTKEIFDATKTLTWSQSNLLLYAFEIGSGFLGQVVRLSSPKLLDDALIETNSLGHFALLRAFNKNNTDDEVVDLLNKATIQGVNRAACCFQDLGHSLPLSVLDVVLIQKRSRYVIDTLMRILTPDTLKKICMGTGLEGLTTPPSIIASRKVLPLIARLVFYAIPSAFSPQSTFNKNTLHLVRQIPEKILFDGISVNRQTFFNTLITFNPLLLNDMIKKVTLARFPLCRQITFLHDYMTDENIALALMQDPALIKRFKDEEATGVLPLRVYQAQQENQQQFLLLFYTYLALVEQCSLAHDTNLLVVEYLALNAFLLNKTIKVIDEMRAATKLDHLYRTFSHEEQKTQKELEKFVEYGPSLLVMQYLKNTNEDSPRLFKATSRKKMSLSLSEVPHPQSFSRKEV